MLIDEAKINAERRAVYINRIRSAIKHIGVIDGCDTTMLANELVQSFAFALQHHLAEWTRVELRPQLGMGTKDWIRIRGRLAERSKVQMPGADDDPFDILISCWYRFLISSQAPAPLLARRGTREVLTATDEEGFFDFAISTQPDLGDAEGHFVDIQLGEQATLRAEKAVARACVPSESATVAAMVDLDGLVLSHPTTRFAQVLGEVVLGESQRLRKPLDGAANLLDQIARGEAGPNPVFYLSNAPRHLYKHLQTARRYAELPEGYIHLRDYGLRLRRLTTSHVNVIEMLLAHDMVDHYPDLPFIFIGTRERWEFYEPLLKALCHRLDAVFLVGDEGMPDALTELNKELHLNFVTSSGEQLLMHAVQRGWARA